MATDVNLPSSLKPLPMSQRVETRERVGASSVSLVLFRLLMHEFRQMPSCLGQVIRQSRV
jgi:hypothetical protein